MENKKFYTAVENGKICYRMVIKSSCVVDCYYTKYKPCHLEFIDKKLVALNPDVDRSYGYKYNYKIVCDTDKRAKSDYVPVYNLIGPDIYDIKDKHI